MLLGEASKKKTGFFRKTPKGGEGGLAESKISLSEKTEIFLEFFLQRGGVSPIPKGCYHKKMGILGYFCQKGGSYRFYQKKTQNISDFFAKRGGGSGQFQNFLIRKNSAIPNCWGGGGVSEFRSFSEKKTVFFFDASPKSP